MLTYSDAEAQQLFASPDFRSKWTSPISKCAWSTAFQTLEFACTWYQCYSDVYRPPILIRYGGGDMDGLLTRGDILPSRRIIDRTGIHYTDSIRCRVRFGMSTCTVVGNP